MWRLFRQIPLGVFAEVPFSLCLALAGCSSDVASTVRSGGPAPLIFGPEQHLGDTSRNPSAPFLRLAPDGRLFAVWTEDDSRASTKPTEAARRHHGSAMKMRPSPFRVAIVASSDNGGKTWSAPMQVHDSIEAIEGEEGGPRIAFGSDNNPYVVWSTPNEKGDKTRANIRFAAGDGKGRFIPPRTLNEIKDTARFPTIEAMPDNSLLVGWIDRRVDNPVPRSLYLMRINAAGQQLTTSYKIGAGLCECCRLSISVADGGNTVYMVDRQVSKNQVRNHALRKSTDGGKTFGEPVEISDDGWQVPSCPHSGPTIGQDRRGHLHVTWFTLGRSEKEAGIYYTVSRDGGHSFAPRQLVHANTAPEILHATLAVGHDGTVYFAWDNLDEKSKAQVFVRSLKADGQSWSPIQQISNTTGNASRPMMAISDNQLHVAWTETQGERSWIVLKTAAVGK